MTPFLVRDSQHPLSMRLFASLLIVGALANIVKAAPTPAETAHVEVKGARVRAKDVFPGHVADLDLGPAPATGATRVIEKDDIEKAFAEAKATPPAMIPAHVRVSRNGDQ
jgi:hypothetical protein